MYIVIVHPCPLEHLLVIFGVLLNVVLTNNSLTKTLLIAQHNTAALWLKRVQIITVRDSIATP